MIRDSLEVELKTWIAKGSESENNVSLSPDQLNILKSLGYVA